MYFCFAYDYTGRSTSRISLHRLKKMKKKDRVIVVKLKRPYFTGEKEHFGDNIFHSLETVMSFNGYSESIKNRFPKAREGTFIPLHDNLCSGGPKYGLLTISDEEYQSYITLIDSLKFSQKKEQDLFKILSKNNDFAEYIKSIQDQKDFKKSIASFLDEE